MRPSETTITASRIGWAPVPSMSVAPVIATEARPRAAAERRRPEHRQ